MGLKISTRFDEILIVERNASTQPPGVGISPGHGKHVPGNSRSQQRIPRRSGVSREQPSPRNYSWAELMHRVWAVDVLQCPRCSGGMRIVAAIHPPAAIRAILDCLGLPARAPPIAAAAEREERNEWEVC